MDVIATIALTMGSAGSGGIHLFATILVKVFGALVRLFGSGSAAQSGARLCG